MTPRARRPRAEPKSNCSQIARHGGWRIEASSRGETDTNARALEAHNQVRITSSGGAWNVRQARSTGTQSRCR